MIHLNTIKTLRPSSLTIPAVVVGIAAGAILTVSQVNSASHTVNLKNSDATSPDTSQAAPADATPSDTVPATTETTTTSSTPPVNSSANTTSDVPQNPPAPTQTSQLTASTIAPPTPVLVSADQTSSQDGDLVTYTCHFHMSDGSTIDKFAGSANAQDIATYNLKFSCRQ